MAAVTRTAKGRDPISEKMIRGLASECGWERQRRAFERLLASAPLH